MNHGCDLYFLSAVACQLSECLAGEELELLAVHLKALGEMLEVISARQKIVGRESEP